MSATDIADPSTSTHPSKKRDGVSQKSRIHRRRRRAGIHGVDSDDEIERDALSDVSGSDTQSHPDSVSESDSDSEPESEVVANGGSRAGTPNTTRSNHSIGGPPSTKPVKQPAFASQHQMWSDIVTDEALNNDIGLPVIDFADMQRRESDMQDDLLQGTSQLVLTDGARSPSPPPSVQENALESSSGAQSHHTPHDITRRPSGQTARQAYQQRLQNDPSFVPTVGEFWGHDDRLLQKDLRSLSGWWRGRWQGRGRGRGGFRGGWNQVQGRSEGPTSESLADGANGFTPQPSETHSVEPPPIDQPWKHDGFEELKIRDQKRRSQAHFDQMSSSSSRGGFTTRGGRGHFVPARGAFNQFAPRGKARTGSPYVSTRVPAVDRVWFAMKPERVWTKQHDGFLYLDPSSRSKHTETPTIRIHLTSDKDSLLVHAVSTISTSSISHARSVSVDDADRSVVVRLPPKRETPLGSQNTATVPPEPITTMEDLFPEATEPTHLSISELMGSAADAMSTLGWSSDVSPMSNMPPPLHESSLHPPPSIPTGPLANGNTSSADINIVSPRPSESQLFKPPPLPLADSHPTGQLPPLQTSFASPNQPSPSYGSPYSFTPQPPQLPPGIALSPQGYAYEYATGRPVYLHATPPPGAPTSLPLYNPRPIAHSHTPSLPFVPGHIHHPSTMSTEYLPQPLTPPINGFVDPATGAPIFSLPRQNSRVEIRAPTDSTESKGKTERQPSGLRTEVERSRPVQEFRPAPATYPVNGSTPVMPVSYNQPDGMDSQPAQATMDPNAMGYMPYQQYYYPDHYMYPPYMDVSQQNGQYDSYQPDMQHPDPGTMYY